MKKPTVYIDTSVISAYWYRGANALAIARRVRTHEWWQSERPNFDTWTSNVTESELREGVFPRQLECIRMAKQMKYLAITGAANALYQHVMAKGVVPSNKPRDGLQIAIATAHEIDYLLSWNYAHLANPIVQAKLEKICQAFGLRFPVLVSPETIPNARLGETIRRRLK